MSIVTGETLAEEILHWKRRDRGVRIVGGKEPIAVFRAHGRCLRRRPTLSLICHKSQRAPRDVASHPGEMGMAETSGLMAQFEEDKKLAWRAYQSQKYEEGLAISARYAGPASKNREFLFIHALLLQGKCDFEGAEPFFVRLLALAPESGDYATRHAAGLSNMGRRGEALALLETSRLLDPTNDMLLGEYLGLLMTERGLPAALAVLGAEHSRRSPGRKLESAIERLRGKALSLLDPEEIRRSDPENLLGIVPEGAGRSYTLRGMYEAFEPLGCNCEFGFVQRRRGVEPLSLFRWTAITPENLARLLGCDMAGYERPEIYSLRGNPAREYHLYEEAFGTETHTGVNQGDIPPDEFLARLTRRQGFLKRKFLADAAEGRKIFLYKADHPLSEEQMAGMERELTRLGVRHCFFVMPSGETHAPGTVEIVSPNRTTGYLTPVTFNEKLEEWDRIVVKAYDHFLGQGAGS